MNSFHFIIFALLLCISFSSGIETDQNEYGFEIDQRKEVKTQITDLDDDIFYLIFEILKLNDLVNIVTVIPRTSYIATDIIHRNYPELSILVYYSGISKINLSFVYTKRVEIFDVQLCLNTLKMFGRGFQKIYIHYVRIKESDRAIVTEFINKYTSKTLTQLTLDSIDDNVLDHLTIPFEEVEEFTCNIHNMENINGSKSWNYLFPKLRRLEITMYSVADLSFIDCKLPHLEHIILSIAKVSWGRIDTIKQLFAKNQQIKSVKLGSTFPNGFAKVIKQLLPNVENLTLTPSYIGEEPICFENVKNIELEQIRDSDVLKNLLLPKLETLTMHYYAKTSSGWTAFFKRHSNISHLYIIDDGYDINLKEVTADLINLVDVSIRTINPLGSDIIIEFIESQPKLQKFGFKILIDKFLKNLEDTLRQRFENEWIITEIKQTFVGLCFERKEINH